MKKFNIFTTKVHACQERTVNTSREEAEDEKKRLKWARVEII